MAGAGIIIDVTRPIDRARRGWRPTGVDVVCQKYAGHFGGRSAAAYYVFGRFMLFSGWRARWLFSRVGAWKKTPLVAVAALWVLQVFARGAVSAPGAFFLNVAHSGIMESRYVRALQRLNVRAVFAVHDLIPLEYPQFVKKGDDLTHRLRIRNILQSAAGIFTISADVGDRLRRFAEQEGLPMPPHTVAHLAVRPLPAVPADAHAPFSGAPYFVVVGTIEPRKNHRLLLDLWRSLLAEKGRAVPRLVVIGQKGWECDDIVDALTNDTVLRSAVTYLPACADDDLACYLKFARALLFPTFAEGYGLPLVEALQAGTPVIASDLAVFREVSGNIPDYAGVVDIDAWQCQVVDYARNASVGRTGQLARIKQFDPPTWADHFAIIENFMSDLG